MNVTRLAYGVASAKLGAVPKRDANQEALRQVEQITGSKPVRGETLLRSRKLKRKLAEAKESLQKKKRSD